MSANNKEILDAITLYAESYAQLEKIQSDTYAFPKGDQKTGSIGEYYAYLYLKNKYPEAIVQHCMIDNEGWDIKLTINDKVELIQVKTVSAFSFNRRISPIKDGFNKLYLISLDECFFPNAFWILDMLDFSCAFPIRHKNMRLPNSLRTDRGKGVLKYSQNYIDDFKLHIQEAISKNIK